MDNLPARGGFKEMEKAFILAIKFKTETHQHYNVSSCYFMRAIIEQSSSVFNFLPIAMKGN